MWNGLTFKWHHTCIFSVKADSEANRPYSGFGSRGAPGGPDFISASSHSAVVRKDAAASTAHTRTASPMLAPRFRYTQVTTPTSKYSVKNITEKNRCTSKVARVQVWNSVKHIFLGLDFHTTCHSHSLREAEQLLEDKPQGCFLLRLSESKIGFVLSYR